VGLDHALGRGCSQFIDHLLEERTVGVAVQRNASIRTPARKIQDLSIRSDMRVTVALSRVAHFLGQATRRCRISWQIGE
jgi:hypothetical protein